MIRMIYALTFSLVCLFSTFAQAPGNDPWKKCLLPPRNSLQWGQSCSVVAGKLQAVSNEPADKIAQRGWIEHRLKKQPGDVQLWEEYLGLVDKTDALSKPSHEKALAAVQEALKRQPNDPKLMQFRAQLWGDLEQKEQQREGLAELVEKHPKFIPGLIDNNELAYDDKKYEDCVRFARELVKQYPNEANACVHHSTLLFREIGRRLYVIFPNKVFDQSGIAFPGLSKEFQDLLASAKDDPGRSRALQEEYAAINSLVIEARQSMSRASLIMEKDEKQRIHAVEVFGCDMVLEICQAGMLGREDKLDFQTMLSRKSKELSAMLATTLVKKDDAPLQTAAACGIFMKVFMGLMADETCKPQMEAFTGDQRLDEDAIKQMAALMKQKFPAEHQLQLGIIVNLKRLAQTDYPPIVGMVEHTLGLLSIFVEGDLQAARGHFLRALQQDPTRRNSYECFLGTCSLLKEKLRWEALPVAVREQQDTAEGHVVFVKALMNSDHPDDVVAMRHISVALDQDPKHPVALFIKAALLARTDSSAKSLDQAAALCEQAFELAYRTTPPTVIVPEFYLAAGAIDVMRGKTFAARRYFEDGLQVKPNDSGLKQAIDRMNGVVQVEGRKDK